MRSVIQFTCTLQTGEEIDPEEALEYLTMMLTYGDRHQDCAFYGEKIIDFKTIPSEEEEE